jgi:hypothetical protein
MGDGDHQVGVAGRDGAVDGGDHPVGAVPLDHAHRHSQVGAGRVVLGVVDDLLPGAARDQLGIPGPLAGLEPFGRAGEGEHLFAVADQMHPPAGLMRGHESLDGPRVRPAQHRVRRVQRAEGEVATRVALDPQIGTDYPEPHVGLLRHRGTEPPRLGQGETMHGVHPGEEVPGAPLST